MPAFLAELRADLMTRWLTRAGWKTMLAAAPKPELEQVLLRIGVPLLATLWLCGDFLMHGELDPGEKHGLIFAVGFLAFAVAMLLLLLATKQQGRIVVVRRVIGMIADNAANTYCLIRDRTRAARSSSASTCSSRSATASASAAATCTSSQALSIVGFAHRPAGFRRSGRSTSPIGVGFMVALLVLPFYVGVLAQRITEAEASRRRGERRQGTLPRQRQPRDAHAAQRRHRDGRRAARDEPERSAARDRRDA